MSHGMGGLRNSARPRQGGRCPKKGGTVPRPVGRVAHGPITPIPSGGMAFTFISGRNGTGAIERDLARVSRFALDLEAAGFHRYTDRICLAQVTVMEATYVLDPLTVDVAGLLKGPLEDADVEVLAHGADHDLRLLHRYWGITLRGLFDTRVAAALLGLEATGLGALVSSRLGISLSKAYQRADWAKRPLSAAMLAYAASDTMYLPSLADELVGELRAMGREAWAHEECRALEEAACAAMNEAPPELAAGVRGATHLEPKELEALRVALTWREGIAKRRDLARFRVVGDAALLEAVTCGAKSVKCLVETPGFPSKLARDEGEELVRELEVARTVSEEDVMPLKPWRGRRAVRVPPELADVRDRVRDVRNRLARHLGIDRGELLSNATIAAIVRRGPRTLAELGRVDGMRRWRVQVLGQEVMDALWGS